MTGWFKHSSGQAYDLRLRGVAEAVGVTAMHPIWSVDRLAWVPAGELRPGERVQGKESVLAVESFTKRDNEEPVYNIEVEGDHCYRVGQHGLLVHNQSVPTRQELIDAARTYRMANNLTRGSRNLGGIIYTRLSDCMVLRYPPRYPADLTSSREGLHTEPLIDAHLTGDPNIDNIAGSIMIHQLFTERDPCPGCLRRHIPSLERKHGGPFWDQIIWFVEYGPTSNMALRQLYGFPEP